MVPVAIDKSIMANNVITALNFTVFNVINSIMYQLVGDVIYLYVLCMKLLHHWMAITLLAG